MALTPRRIGFGTQYGHQSVPYATARYAIATLFVQEVERYFKESNTTLHDTTFGDECIGYGWVQTACQNATLGSDMVNVSVVSDIDLWATFELSPDLGLLSNVQTYKGFTNSCITETPLVKALVFEQWTDLKNFSLTGNAEQRPKAAANISQTTALPKAMQQWTNLEHLNLDHGVICGTLPSWIGQWNSFVSLSIQANELLHGTLPESVGNWTALEQLWVDHTYLTGT
jgi:hypothetical protein